jgi:hypothetical protein
MKAGPIDMLHLIAILLVTPLLFVTLLMFDQLFRLEYTTYRKNWDADGQPHGFFWVPPEVRRFGGLLIKGRSSLAARRCAFFWLFKTPNWARSDNTALRLLFWIRLLLLISNMALLAFFIFKLAD